jgi:hypothetical protein
VDEVTPDFAGVGQDPVEVRGQNGGICLLRRGDNPAMVIVRPPRRHEPAEFALQLPASRGRGLREIDDVVELAEPDTVRDAPEPAWQVPLRDGNQEAGS